MPGTAPAGWQTPKTDYNAKTALLPEQHNRIEGNIHATELGERTIDPSQAPTGVVGTLRQLLDWFANRIKAITGEDAWHTAPAATLKATKEHIDNTTTAHDATSAATASKMVVRDTNGRAQVASPSAAGDIATKEYVDDLVAKHTEGGTGTFNYGSGQVDIALSRSDYARFQIFAQLSYYAAGVVTHQGHATMMGDTAGCACVNTIKHDPTASYSLVEMSYAAYAGMVHARFTAKIVGNQLQVYPYEASGYHLAANFVWQVYR